MFRPLLLLLATLLPGLAGAQAGGVPTMDKPIAAPAPAQATGFKTITWDVLVPPGWDPFKDFKGMDLNTLQDGDPRATQLLKKMREAWDNAPVNANLVNQPVRIPGYVVPLEDSKDGLKEFLLVPYFGACIHTPPPPSNQIIHVLPRSAAKGYRSMDAVWITGVLKQVQTDSYMGASSWRIEAQSVSPYAEPAPKGAATR
jgi:hypothetical protein